MLGAVLVWEPTMSRFLSGAALRITSRSWLVAGGAVVTLYFLVFAASRNFSTAGPEPINEAYGRPVQSHQANLLVASSLDFDFGKLPRGGRRSATFTLRN